MYESEIIDVNGVANMITQSVDDTKPSIQNSSIDSKAEYSLDIFLFGPKPKNSDVFSSVPNMYQARPF